MHVFFSLPPAPFSLHACLDIDIIIHCWYLSLCVVCVLQRVAGDCEAWTQAAGVWSFYASLHSCEGTDLSGSLKLIEVLGSGAEEKTVM
jgi:hypothetical protein